jgi:Flp pilus assembly protein TadG
MIKVARGLSCRESGVTTIEFALVFPLFLLVVFGIMDASAVAYDLVLLTNASRETARASVVSADPTQHDVKYYWSATPSDARYPAPSTYCTGHMISLGSGGSKSCTPPTAIGQPAPGAALTVTVTYEYHSLISRVSGIPFQPTLHATTTMQYE